MYKYCLLHGTFIIFDILIGKTVNKNGHVNEKGHSTIPVYQAPSRKRK